MTDSRQSTRQPTITSTALGLSPDFSALFFAISRMALSALQKATRKAPKQMVPNEVVKARNMAPRTGARDAAPRHHQSPSTLAAQKAATLWITPDTQK